MEDDDCLAIEAQLAVLAAAIGGSTIMKPRHYRLPIREPLTRDGEARADRPMAIGDRVIAEIEALERHLSLLDIQNYKDAMGRIHHVLSASADRAADIGPTDAVIQLDSVSGEPSPILHLSELPDLSEVRFSLQRLASSMRSRV